MTVTTVPPAATLYTTGLTGTQKAAIVLLQVVFCILSLPGLL